jgi:hypothetical protein
MPEPTPINNVVRFPADRLYEVTGEAVEDAEENDSDIEECEPRISVIHRNLPWSFVEQFRRITINEIAYLYGNSPLVWDNVMFWDEDLPVATARYIEAVTSSFATEVTFRLLRERLPSLGEEYVPSFVYSPPFSDERETMLFYGSTGLSYSVLIDLLPSLQRIEHEIAGSHLSFFHADLAAEEFRLSRLRN